MQAEVVARYLERQPLTQALAYAAILQARGVACLLAGAAVCLLQPKDGVLLARMQRPRQIDMTLLESIRQRAGSQRVLVEPAAAGVLVGVDQVIHRWRFDLGETEAFAALVQAHGWTIVSRAYTHTKTQVIDLRGGLAAALAGATSVARRNLRASQRDGVEYAARPFGSLEPDELRALRRVHDEFHAARPHLKDDWAFRTEMLRQFGPAGELITAREQGELVGALFMPRHDGVAHYYAVVTSSRARSRKVGTGLVHQALKTACDRGCDLFDFVGVRDERYPDRHQRWVGFSAFKERFGGHAVYMPPSLELRPDR